VNQTLCIELSLNNIVGSTWSINIPSDLTAEASLYLFKSQPVGLITGESVFVAVDQYNRLPTGQAYKTNWTIVAPNIPTPYEMTVYLRADNADMAVVNNTIFSWADASPAPQWAGSIFFSDVSPSNSKQQCKEFSFLYEVHFPLGALPTAVNVTTTGLDTDLGQVQTYAFIPSGTIGPVAISGNFTAGKGAFEFRLIAELQPEEQIEAPFEIQATAFSIIRKKCTDKKDNGLSTGELIGIIVGATVGGLIVIIGIAWGVRHFSNSGKQGYESFE